MGPFVRGGRSGIAGGVGDTDAAEVSVVVPDGRSDPSLPSLVHAPSRRSARASAMENVCRCMRVTGRGRISFAAFLDTVGDRAQPASGPPLQIRARWTRRLAVVLASFVPA